MHYVYVWKAVRAIFNLFRYIHNIWLASFTHKTITACVASCLSTHVRRHAHTPRDREAVPTLSTMLIKLITCLTADKIFTHIQFGFLSDFGWWNEGNVERTLETSWNSLENGFNSIKQHHQQQQQQKVFKIYVRRFMHVDCLMKFSMAISLRILTREFKLEKCI